MPDKVKIAIFSPNNISFYTATGSLLYFLFENFSDEQIVQVTKNWYNNEDVGKFNNIIPFRDFLWKERNSKNKLIAFAAKVVRHFCGLCKIFFGNKKEVLKSVEKFEPDVLYLRIVGEPYYYLPMTLYVKKKLNIPLVIHFMDDFELRLLATSKYNLARKITYYLYNNLLKKVLSVSDVNFVISESMKEAFAERYGKEFKVAHNGIKDADRDYYISHRQKKADNKFTLLWAGSLEKTKDQDIILSIAKAVELLSAKKRLKKEVELLLNIPRIHLDKAKVLAKEFDFISYQEYQPVEEYKKLLGRVHLLLIGRNFDDSTKAYTQYSFHNKLPDFLASRTPILCIGPEWDNTLNIFKRHQIGKYVSSENQNDIADAIAGILYDYEKALDFAGKAADKAYQLYGMNKIRENFEKAIISCVSERDTSD